MCRSASQLQDLVLQDRGIHLLPKGNKYQVLKRKAHIHVKMYRQGFQRAITPVLKQTVPNIQMAGSLGTLAQRTANSKFLFNCLMQ